MPKPTKLSIDTFVQPKVGWPLSVLLVAVCYNRFSFAQLHLTLQLWHLLLIVPTGYLLLYVHTWASTIYRRGGTSFGLGPQDVVLLLGGSRGLGRELLREFQTCKVCVVDKEPLDWPNAETETETETDTNTNTNIRFFQCDLVRPEDVLAVINKVEAKVGRISVLINNAGIKCSDPVRTTDFQDVQKVFSVNYFSYFLATQRVLQLRDNDNDKGRLFVVNVASILGLVSPAFFSVYSATKASIIAFHESLSQEPQHAATRFLLVNLGQLDTQLFEDVSASRTYIAPVLSHKAVAKEIFKRVAHDQPGELTMPLYGNFMPILRVMPFLVSETLRKFSLMDKAKK